MDIQNFAKMSAVEKAAVYYNATHLDSAVRPNYPQLLENGLVRKTVPASKALFFAFWSKVDVTCNSDQPTCRENAQLVTKI
jgi:hypothetical protein